jgi:cytochrome c553
MRISKILIGLGLTGTCVAAALAAEPVAQVLQKPEWAYAIPTAPPGPPTPRDQRLHSLPGTDRQFTWDQVQGRRPPGFTGKVGPADWFPDEHPPMPDIVAYGDPARGILPCALCHYPSGKGRSENASVAGLPKDYMVQTMRDMRDGLRVSAEPRKTNAGLMVRYAKAMTDAEMEASAAYYASIPWTPHVKVVESRTGPKVRNLGGLLLPHEGAQAGVEPLGNRILEVTADGERTELRDPHSPFIAYVPVGSLAKGRALVATGGRGRTVACGACHGEDLNGIGPIPGIAGRSPSYIARQLNDLRQGARRGPWAPLMTRAVQNLTDDDILNISAYVAAQPPPASARSASAQRR